MSLTPDFFDRTRGKKILLIEPMFWTPHLETGLELAELLSEHNEVTYVGPDVLGCITDETVHLHARIRIALTRKRSASKYVRGDVRAYRRSEIAAITAKLNVPDVSEVFDPLDPNLEKLMVGNFDVGMAVVSSIISLTRDAHFDRGTNSRRMTALARDAIRLYHLTQALISQSEADLVFLFNGRIAPTRAILRACEKMGVRFIVHERGSSRSKYALFDRATSHLPRNIRRWVDDWWQIGDTPEANARSFLEQRRNNISTSWYSFTGKQSAGQFPPRGDKTRVTFFTSSDDELVAIGDELAPDSPFCDQPFALRAIGEACQARGYEFIVRFHPNTPARQQGLVEIAREFSALVIDPASQVDTYGLMDSSDIVFTQNSTAGIEAAATGKPVFYAGRSVFEHCRSVKRIMSEADLADALDRPQPADPMDALRYANYFGQHGIEYRFYRPRGFLSGTFHGLDLNSPLSTIRNLKLRLSRGGT